MMSIVITQFQNWEDNSNGGIVFSSCVSMIVLARAMLTPIVDSLMVIQMKLDKIRGSEDLETFGRIC